MPWRNDQDPYKIWVSEIMLQQTQVKTVIPFYEKFLKRFPSLKNLAQASEAEVLSAWSGLGYYRRAKLLHRGAQWVMANRQGKIPNTAQELKAIPGIGPYTAGAIASIAFKQASPLVDGNVVRVIARIFCHPGPAKSPSLNKKIWQEAEKLIDPEFPGDFNQALMELGATVCRKYLPSCQRCPVQKQCQSFINHCVEQFPEPAPRQAHIKLTRVVAICEQDGGILLVKRRVSRWFENMWELPHDYCEDPEAGETTLKFLLSEQLKSKMTQQVKVPTSTHQITQHRITSLAWRGLVKKPKPCPHTYQSFEFFQPEQLKELPLPNFERKVLQKAQILV